MRDLLSVDRMTGGVKRAAPEYELQKTLVKHLQIRQRPNVYWCAIPNGGGRTSAKTGAHLKAMGLRAGAPDLLVIVNGTAWGIELKAGKRPQLSDVQLQTCIEWNKAGGEYHAVTGLDSALQFLEDIGAIEPDSVRRVA